ncbi:MAG TPA: type II toxin-antitoxin system ParD family antitoxin [Thermomicrobiales bacterium]|nr:type II toxin-antitoxin system ParD family antitoxin [Thermomicrobiales bacterium]
MTSIARTISEFALYDGYQLLARTSYWHEPRENTIMAARSISISLGDHFTEFIEEQIESGRYNTASEVVQAGLRLLEEKEQKLARLRADIAKGVDDFEQGRVYEDSDDFWKRINREVDASIAREDEERARARVAS